MSLKKILNNVSSLETFNDFLNKNNLDCRFLNNGARRFFSVNSKIEGSICYKDLLKKFYSIVQCSQLRMQDYYLVNSLESRIKKLDTSLDQCKKTSGILSIFHFFRSFFGNLCFKKKKNWKKVLNILYPYRSITEKQLEQEKLLKKKKERKKLSKQQIRRIVIEQNQQKFKFDEQIRAIFRNVIDGFRLNEEGRSLNPQELGMLINMNLAMQYI